MKTILEIMEDQDWEIAISIDSTSDRQSIIIEGDSRSFKMLAGVLLGMAQTVKEQGVNKDHKTKQKGYGVVIAPEDVSQLVMPHSDNLILECTPRKPKKKRGKK